MTMTARVPAPMYTKSPLELEFDWSHAGSTLGARPENAPARRRMPAAT